jgi:hypothetical protein
VVALHPVHPFAEDPSRLDLRLYVNGIELRAEPAAGGDLAFALYRGLRRVEELRLCSAVFVPQERNGSSDARRLGVPVRSLRLE